MAFLKKIPIVATAFNISDFLSVLDTKNRRERFEKELSGYLGSKYVFSVNSGTSAFYLILKALVSEYPDKKEVILPAYTAASLVLPIQKLELKVVLCDISLETFNLDIDQAADLISDNTLCVVAVHLFGLAADIDGLKFALNERNKKAIIVEDCAQAMGTTVDGRPVGSKADISLYSFNRGKNLSTCSGGAISTCREDLSILLRKELASLKALSILGKLRIVLELMLLSLAVKPFIYNLLYPLLRVFRSVKPPVDFFVSSYANIQAAVGSSLLKRLEVFSNKRYRNACALRKSLSSNKNVLLPSILSSSRPAFNRFPIVFKDSALKEKIKKEFLKEGIDTSGMYGSPLHLIFDLKLKEGSFPNAEYFSRMLLTLPVHSLVTESTVGAMNKIFEGL